MDIFDKDYLFIPVCEDLHWCARTRAEKRARAESCAIVTSRAGVGGCESEWADTRLGRCRPAAL